jgi:hypothetical protein
VLSAAEAWVANGKDGYYNQTSESAYATTWYDQSGSGNNATQATAASQPLLIRAGVTNTDNGKAALSFDGVDDHLETTYDNANDYTAFWVQSPVDGALGQAAGRGDGIDRHAFGWDAGNYPIHYRGGATDIQGAAGVRQYLGTVLSQPASADCRIYRDGVLGTTSSTIGTETLADMVIGAELSSVSYYGQSDIQELIVYPSDQSANRIGIETNINDHYGIY